MATQHETTDVEQGTQATRGTPGRTGRRGLIAGAAALAAGLLAKQTAQPVSANSNGQALLIATGNTASLTTTLVALNTFSQIAGAFVAGFDATPAPGGQSIAGVVGYGGGDNGCAMVGARASPFRTLSVTSVTMRGYWTQPVRPMASMASARLRHRCRWL